LKVVAGEVGGGGVEMLGLGEFDGEE